MPELNLILVRLAQKTTNLGLEKKYFCNSFWLSKPNCNKIDLKTFQICPIGVNLIKYMAKSNMRRSRRLVTTFQHH